MIDSRISMKDLLGLGAVLVFAFCGTSGCRHEAGPPPPLAAEQIPAEFDRAFKNAKPEAKDLAERVVASLRSKDYPAAYTLIQVLGSLPGNTVEQQSLTARATLTITGLLQAAQSQGDEKAATVLKEYKTYK